MKITLEWDDSSEELKNIAQTLANVMIQERSIKTNHFNEEVKENGKF